MSAGSSPQPAIVGLNVASTPIPTASAPSVEGESNIATISNLVVEGSQFIDEFRRKAMSTSTSQSMSQSTKAADTEEEVLYWDVKENDLWQIRKRKMEKSALGVARMTFEAQQKEKSPPSAQEERCEDAGKPPPPARTRVAKKKLGKIIRKIEDEFWKAHEAGEDVEVWLRNSPKESWASSTELDSVDGILEQFKSSMKIGSSKERIDKANPPKGYRRLRNGITMDSGSNVDIAPAGENPQFPVVDTTGPRRGRRLAAADGTPIKIEGEKCIHFMTKEGHQLAWPFIAGDVRKGLKSVGTTCDAGNYVLFTEWGGYIINDKTHKHIEFDRVGNVYAIDAWVKDEEGSGSSGFARQVRMP